MVIRPNTFAFNLFFVLTIVIIAVKVILAIFLAKKFLEKRKESGVMALDFIFSVFVLMVCLLVARSLYTYFDFFLTEFDSDLYYIEPNIWYWKAGNFVGALGFAYVLFVIDKKVLNFKFKGIITYVLIGISLIQLLYPVNSAEDFAIASALGFASTFAGLLVPIIFFYVGIKAPGLRKTAFLIAFGIIIYGLGANLVSEAILGPLKDAFGDEIQITIFFLFLTLKITGLTMVALSIPKFRL